MKKLYSTFLVLFLSLLISLPLLMALCSGVTIFFANGMNNDRGMAEESLRALKNKLIPFLPAGLDVDFQLAYNHNEGFIPEMVEVAADKGLDSWKSFWNYLSDLETAPDWFQSAAEAIVAGANALNYLIDADLQNQVAAYAEEISKGRKVIVVAHSQGNFYANAAYALLGSSSFGILGVASPASYVAGNGPYVISAGDVLMNGVRSLFGSLPANATNTGTGTGWMGHDFVSSYLEGDVTGPMIVDNVRNMMGDTSDCAEEEEEGEEDPDSEETSEDEPVDPEGPSDVPVFPSVDRYVGFTCGGPSEESTEGAGLLKIDGVPAFTSSEADPCENGDRVILNLGVGEHTFTIEITEEDDSCLETVDPTVCIDIQVTGDGEVICLEYDSPASCEGFIWGGCALTSLSGSGLDVNGGDPPWLATFGDRAGSSESFSGWNGNSSDPEESDLIAGIMAVSPGCVIDWGGR